MSHEGQDTGSMGDVESLLNAISNKNDINQSVIQSAIEGLQTTTETLQDIIDKEEAVRLQVSGQTNTLQGTSDKDLSTLETDLESVLTATQALRTAKELDDIVSAVGALQTTTETLQDIIDKNDEVKSQISGQTDNYPKVYTDVLTAAGNFSSKAVADGLAVALKAHQDNANNIQVSGSLGSAYYTLAPGEGLELVLEDPNEIYASNFGGSDRLELVVESD